MVKSASFFFHICLLPILKRAQFQIFGSTAGLDLKKQNPHVDVTDVTFCNMGVVV